jgi:hypothetical protein
MNFCIDGEDLPWEEFRRHILTHGGKGESSTQTVPRNSTRGNLPITLEALGFQSFEHTCMI